MLSDSLKRFTAAADLLRPTVFFRTLARVDHTVDATRELTVTVNALRARMPPLNVSAAEVGCALAILDSVFGGL